MPSMQEFVPSSHVSACIFVALFAIAILYGIYQRALPKPIPGIPYDVQAAKSLSGDLETLKNDPDGLAKWCSRHLTKLQSPICQIRLGPFSKPVVLIADIGETRHVMMRSEFDRSRYIIDGFPLFGGSQIIMHTNEDWRTNRGWLKDLLTPQYMQNVAGPGIYNSTRQLIELWELKSRIAGPGRPFSMLQDLENLALDVMCHFHHGDEFQDLALNRQIQYIQQLAPNSSEITVGPHNGVTFPRAPMNAFGEDIVEIGDLMAHIYATSLLPGFASWWSQHMVPRYRKYFAEKQTFMKNRFNTAIQRLRDGVEAKTAIDYMVYREEKAAKKAGRKPLYEKQIMVDEAFGNHLAGQHTTSAAMTWILKFLTENADLQVRLRAELQNAFSTAVQDNNRLPTCAEIMAAKLPYLEAVIEETVRLRAAWFIARDSVRDAELLGHRIPKGTVCLLICQGLEDFSSLPSKSGKTARQYPGNGNPDLNVFDPERWLVRSNGEVKFDGSSNPQMAFGLGIRACWGRKLAELELKILTAMMTWNFDILAVPEPLATHDAFYDFSYRAKHGFLQLKKREGAGNENST